MLAAETAGHDLAGYDEAALPPFDDAERAGAEEAPELRHESPTGGFNALCLLVPAEFAARLCRTGGDFCIREIGLVEDAGQEFDAGLLDQLANRARVLQQPEFLRPVA